jgi:ribose 1,5-bisphosphokinase
MLVLVVGPSGAGKDTLLDAARRRLNGDARFRFVRRVITRSIAAGGEAHEAVTAEEFGARSFALSWRAHGLSYGIPMEIAEDLARGVVVVANVSRGVVADAASRFDVRVLEVTAPRDILARRLAGRARETADDISQRLARSAALPVGVEVATILNDSTIGTAAAAFVDLLLGYARSGSRSAMMNGLPGAG